VKVNIRLVIAAFAFLITGIAMGYIGGRKSGDAELGRWVRSLALAQSAKETASYTRLLEGLRDGKTDLVADRLETMLDYSVVDIGIQTELRGLSPDVADTVGRSLCLARNYRMLYPHRPSEGWAAKYFDAALALKTESK